MRRLTKLSLVSFGDDAESDVTSVFSPPSLIIHTPSPLRKAWSFSDVEGDIDTSSPASATQYKDDDDDESDTPISFMSMASFSNTTMLEGSRSDQSITIAGAGFFRQTTSPLSQPPATSSAISISVPSPNKESAKFHCARCKLDKTGTVYIITTEHRGRLLRLYTSLGCKLHTDDNLVAGKLLCVECETFLSKRHDLTIPLPQYLRLLLKVRMPTPAPDPPLPLPYPVATTQTTALGVLGIVTTSDTTSTTATTRREDENSRVEILEGRIYGMENKLEALIQLLTRSAPVA